MSLHKKNEIETAIKSLEERIQRGQVPLRGGMRQLVMLRLKHHELQKREKEGVHAEEFIGCATRSRGIRMRRRFR